MIRYQGRAASYGEVWYDERPLSADGVDILVYRQQTAPIANTRHTPFLSLVNDLCVDDQAIAAAFSKECRYEIRRAGAKDALAMTQFGEADGALAQFIAFYQDFAEQKSLAPVDVQWLEAACGTGRLLFTTAAQGGDTLVWHAYLLCAPTARLMHSASLFRDRDPSFRALVGRANRWLHWNDMLRLKSLGMAAYDWGGMFEDETTPDRAGINRFKRSFGGRPVRSYDCTAALSLKGRVYLPLRDAWRRRRGTAPATLQEETCQPS